MGYMGIFFLCPKPYSIYLRGAIVSGAGLNWARVLEVLNSCEGNLGRGIQQLRRI